MKRSLNCWNPFPMKSWHDRCKESKRPELLKKKKATNSALLPGNAHLSHPQGNNTVPESAGPKKHGGRNTEPSSISRTSMMSKTRVNRFSFLCHHRTVLPPSQDLDFYRQNLLCGRASSSKFCEKVFQNICPSKRPGGAPLFFTDKKGRSRQP